MKQFKTKTIALVSALLFMQGSLFSQESNPQPCACYLGACSGSIANINYSSNAGFTTVDLTAGSITIAGGVLNYQSPAGGDYNRVWTTLNSLVAESQAFVAETRVNITGGNSPGHYVMAFTTSSVDPISSNAAGYPLTDNDGVGVIINKEGSGPSGNNCCTNPCATGGRWMFQIMAKDNATAPVFSTGIPVGAGNSSGCGLLANYYIRLIRYHSWTFLGVYSDPSFTTHIKGSPVCMQISESITNFRRMHQGVITWASEFRTLDMTLDDMKICAFDGQCNLPFAGPAQPSVKDISAVNTIQLSSNIKDHRILITPNPSSGMFKLDVSKADEKITSVAVYDITGKIYKLINKFDDVNALIIDGSDLKNGTYMIEAYGKTKSWKSTIVIQR